MGSLGCVSGVLGVLLCLAAPGGAEPVPEDLQLDRADGDAFLEPAPNPHASLPCEQCHTAAASSYAFARRFGLRLPLLTEGENPVLLCERCHGGAHAFHPGNFRLGGRETPPPTVFPLLLLVEGFERITCTSCHDVHAPSAVNRLLRGFPVDARTGGAPFRTRIDFCAACHGESGVAALSRHGEVEGDDGCGLCHGPRDIAGVIGPLRADLNATCSLCHPEAPGRPRHFAAYNPFPEIRPVDLPGYGVTLQGGRFTCATCHVHHRAAGEDPGLAAGFIAAVSRSNRINPHVSAELCVVCHPVTPPQPGTADAVAPIGEATPTRLCRRCHARDGALQMRHPLAAPPPGFAVPDGWPLETDGTLGCETCHLPGHPPGDLANPRFLRGGPYATRNEVCFRCHREEAYRERNPHMEPPESGCALCHVITGRSAANPAGLPGEALAEPSLLCLRCHNPPDHPAASEHTVLVRARGFLQIDRDRMPLALGKVTCHTCHDSHAEPGAKLLRTAGAGNLCGSCHPF